jgi:outer membrane receptor for ferrienterochelin and colicins
MLRIKEILCFIVILLNFQICNAQQKDDIKDISLDDLLNVKISTATKYDQTMSDAPASVSIITSEDIERFGFHNLADILMHVRGFYTSYDRNYSYVGVRGFGRPSDYNNRILLLLNGNTLNEGVFGSSLLGTEQPLNMDCIERIEIVRGPGSALYGTGAMFAVVNIITKKGIMNDGLNLKLERGSYGNRQGALAYGKEFKNGIDFFVSGLWADVNGTDQYYKELDDSTMNYGIAKDLDWDKYYGIQSTVNFSDFMLHGIITSRKKAIPTAAWDMDFNDPDATSLDEQKYIELKYNHDVSDSKNLVIRGYFNQYHYVGLYPEEEEINSSDKTLDNWTGSEIRFQWDLKANNRLIIGTEYQNHMRVEYKYWVGDTVFFEGNFPKSIFSLYMQYEYQPIRNLCLTLGFRNDNYSILNRSLFTPRIAVVYNPFKKSTIKLLNGKSFRAPGVYEKQYYDIKFQKRNPLLKSEQIQTWEIVWEQRISNNLFSTLSLYQYSMKDLIDLVYDPYDLLYQYQNISKVTANGFEFELNAKIRKGFYGYFNYTFQNPKDKILKETLTNSPSHLIKLGLVYPVYNYFYAALQLYYETERKTVYATDSDPFLLTSVNLSTNYLLNHFKLGLLINNVFNVSYSNPGGLEHRQDLIKQNDRNYLFRIEYNY